jgi:8-oxo-dGTP pyrophosphatase MutT (NUDIX family)
MTNEALFHVGQKAFIEKDGKVLVLYDPIEGLDFPGGRIKEDEAIDNQPSSLIKALKREVLEETNLKIDVLDPFVVWYHVFSKGHRNYGNVVYLVGFRCKYKSGEVKLSNEHNKFKWVDKNNYKSVDDGKDYFNALEKYFH